MAATKWRDIDDLPKIPANYTALTPLWFLDRAAVVHPTRKSVIHGSREYTWRQTYDRCRRLASALADRSIGPGSTVFAFSLPNLSFIFQIIISTLAKMFISKILNNHLPEILELLIDFS